MSKTKYDLVEVTWRDIFGHNDWVEKERWTDPGHAACSTVGYLLPGLKEGYVCLASTLMKMGGESYYHDMNYIPEGTVVKIKKVSHSKV